MPRKAVYAAVTLAVMLVASRFLARIIDATVGIDGDAGMLLLSLAALNAAIAAVSLLLYRRGR